MIVLASRSPRRQELLSRLGLEFETLPADLDETPLAGEAPAQLALRLAKSKAARVFELRPSATVISADTVVARGRRQYGKPVDAADAAVILSQLVGRGHRVITGVAVVGPGGTESAVLTSRVWLAPWGPADIMRYVESGDPLDKAGAYAVQNEAFRPVARLQGCRCNVVGFPLGIVAALLSRVGIPAPTDVSLACPYGPRLGAEQGWCARGRAETGLSPTPP